MRVCSESMSSFSLIECRRRRSRRDGAEAADELVGRLLVVAQVVRAGRLVQHGELVDEQAPELHALAGAARPQRDGDRMPCRAATVARSIAAPTRAASGAGVGFSGRKLSAVSGASVKKMPPP